MKEIGGYFGLEQLINNEYYKDLIPLNNGRNALLYILKAKKIRKLYIPFYLCDSVIDMLKINNYEFEYYKIDYCFMPLLNIELGKDEYLYLVNYYGQLTNEKILNLKKQFGKIIMDNTHSFFQKPILGIDTIYNCRKFFGVPDGAYLSTDVKLNEKIEMDISKDRMMHLLGRYEGLASEYYNYFQESDKSFKSEPIKYMSKLTHNILGAIDYDRVRQIRNENYAYLDSKLCNQNKLNLTVPEGAFTYSFYVENGIEIRKTLAQKKIYISTLWPNVINVTEENSVEYKYAANILPLPCDQRYKLDDMRYIINSI